MVQSPDSASFIFRNSPTTLAAPIKDERLPLSLEGVSASPPADHKVSAPARKGSKKPRSVANMTQEQRSRKRENDRVAQRAIREKTKQRISQLEAVIDHLKNADHSRELQAALQAKESAEAENAQIKRQLANITAMMQDLLTPGQLRPEEQAYASPASQACFSTNPPPASSSTAISPPASATSPSGTLDDHARDTALPNCPPPSTNQHADLLARQRRDMERGLAIGQDRISIDRLVANLPSNVPGFLTTRDTGNRSSVAGGSQASYPYPILANQSHNSMRQSPVTQGPESPQYHSPLPPNTPAALHDLQSTVSPNTPDACKPSQQEQEQPIWATRPLLHESTCTMDDILLRFIQEHRDLLAQGQPRSAVVGPRYPSVASLLNKDAPPTHPLSDILSAVIRTFPNINHLPEQLATVYLMFLTVRWHVETTKENYDSLLPFSRPVPSQLTIPHPAWMDYVPFPLMRDAMIRHRGEYELDEFWFPYTNTLSVNWPYGESYALIQTPGTGDDPAKAEITINPVFDQHIRNIENWTVGEAFARRFPELQGTYRLKEGT